MKSGQTTTEIILDGQIVETVLDWEGFMVDLEKKRRGQNQEG